ncbi:MAG: hypothetical protein HDS04_03265 [Bacteroides sp.]|nr:hypothetical protein [Bacteroides sp.]
MELFDFANEAYKNYKLQTGNYRKTDIICPKCGTSQLYMMDGLMYKTGYCPACHFNLEDEIRKNGGGPSAPSTGMLIY